MSVITGLVATGLAAAMGSRLSINISPFDGDGIRSHLVAGIGSTVVLSLAASLIDLYLVPTTNLQNAALENAIFASMGYALGIVGSYLTEFVQDRVDLGG
jgi:uncharacterized membrane protein YeaQ/YmgE (transglycosylase-associated protein family)